MYVSHVVVLVFVVAATVYVMMAAGVQKRALDWKREQRLCPACGRHPCRCGH